VWKWKGREIEQWLRRERSVKIWNHLKAMKMRHPLMTSQRRDKRVLPDQRRAKPTAARRLMAINMDSQSFGFQSEFSTAC